MSPFTSVRCSNSRVVSFFYNWFRRVSWCGCSLTGAEIVFVDLADSPVASGGGLDKGQFFCTCPSFPHKKQAPCCWGQEGLYALCCVRSVSGGRIDGLGGAEVF